MLAEDIKTIVHRDVEEAWNKGNLDVLDESYATDFILHQPPFPDLKGSRHTNNRLQTHAIHFLIYT